MTALDMCRVTVRAGRPGPSASVDLVLPTQLDLGEVLPDVVDLVGGRREVTNDDFTERLRLSRLDGSVLDESLTLHENGVRDGDVLLLTAERIQKTAWHSDDLSQHVVDISASADRDIGWPRAMGAVAFWCSSGIGATTWVWRGPAAPGTRAVFAAIVAVAATIAAIAASRIDTDPVPTMTLGAAAAVFGAVAGFLVVPGGPTPPNFFLAAAICSAVSAVLVHVAPSGTTFFMAITAFSTMAAIVAAVVALWPAPTATVGAVLAATSLAMMNIAAKLSILVAGLSPRIPSAVDAIDDEESVAATVGALRAARGHQTVTGLLAGFSLSAALGVALIIADRHTENVGSDLAFTGVVSAALILRAGQQRGAVRSTTVLAAGLISTTAVFTLAFLSAPRHATWVGLIAIALGTGALCLTRADFGSRLSPFARRGIEVVDYLALAAVVPLACWVGGLFGFVRGLSLA